MLSVLLCVGIQSVSLENRLASDKPSSKHHSYGSDQAGIFDGHDWLLIHGSTMSRAGTVTEVVRCIDHFFGTTCDLS